MIHPDAFWTAPWLCAALFKNVKFPGPIWECAAGSGNIVKAAQAAGYRVIASDIYDEYEYYGQCGKIDFLTDTPSYTFRSIITNPPYRKVGDLNPVRDFLYRACCHYSPEKVAFLLSTECGLTDVIDTRLTGDMGLSAILLPKQKPKFGHANGRKAYVLKWPSAWFVLTRSYTGNPNFFWV